MGGRGLDPAPLGKTTLTPDLTTTLGNRPTFSLY